MVCSSQSSRLPVVVGVGRVLQPVSKVGSLVQSQTKAPQMDYQTLLLLLWFKNI